MNLAHAGQSGCSYPEWMTQHGNIVLSIFSSSIFRGAPADPLFEGVREGKRIFVSDRLRNGLNFVAGHFEQIGRFAHAQVGDLVHGRAPEVAMAKAAQMLGAAAGQPGQGGGIPFLRQPGIDCLPEIGEAIAGVPGLRKTHGVPLDQFGPVLDCHGVGEAVHFIEQPLNGGAKWATVKARKHRSGSRNEGTLILRLLVPNPTKGPAHFGFTMKRMQNMRRGEAGHPVSTDAPATVQKNAAFAIETGQKIRPAQIGSNHGVWMRRRSDSHMADMMEPQGGTLLVANDPFAGVSSHQVCFR